MLFQAYLTSEQNHFKNSSSEIFLERETVYFYCQFKWVKVEPINL